MTPTKIGFTRESIIEYIFENLAEESETRSQIGESTDEELLQRVLDANTFENDEECAGILSGKFPPNVICFMTVYDAIGGTPVSIEEYLVERDKEIEVEDDF